MRKLASGVIGLVKQRLAVTIERGAVILLLEIKISDLDVLRGPVGVEGMKFLRRRRKHSLRILRGKALLGWSLASLGGGLRSMRVSRLELSPASRCARSAEEAGSDLNPCHLPGPGPRPGRPGSGTRQQKNQSPHGSIVTRTSASVARASARDRSAEASVTSKSKADRSKSKAAGGAPAPHGKKKLLHGGSGAARVA